MEKENTNARVLNPVYGNGLDLEREKLEQDGSEWTFGALSPVCLAQIPADERIKYLPKGEVQFGVEDFMDCATRGLLNLLETKLNYLLEKDLLPNKQWFKDNGYITDTGFQLSDRYNAILSGTSRQGNSLKAPLDSIRKDGVIPKYLLYANSKMSFNDYHNKKDIKDSMITLGKDFLRRISINYEKVYKSQFNVFDDVLDVAGYAWSVPVNGVYPRIIGMPNHVWMNIAPEYFAFDNYIDSTDGDFIKKLAPDYEFYDYGYRLILSNTIEAQNESILKLLVNLLKSYVNYLSQVKRTVGAVISSLFPPKQGD